MLRLIVVGIIIGCPFSAEAADKEKLTEARLRLQKGNYAEARELYATIAKESKQPALALIGVARSYQGEGEYAKALEVLANGVKQDSEHADLLATQAELLYLTGKWDEATKAADAARKTDKDHFLARWVHARILRDRGEYEKADEEMRWFVRTYTDRSNADNDIKDADLLLLVGQAGTERARRHNLTQQFKFILNEVYGDALKYDKNCWQAEYLAGMMLLEKYNRPEAVKAFDTALKLNPRSAEAFTAKGYAALQAFEIKEADNQVAEALKINPRLVDALKLQSGIHILSGSFDAALKSISAALEVNPRDEGALAHKAAIHHLEKQKGEFKAVIAAVQQQNPKPALFYHELASLLEERKYYAEAETYYRKAIELNDKFPAPVTGLGMLYLRLAKEKEARELLDKSFAADPFNVRVANSRKVLKHLDQYTTIETKHYTLRYDPKTDAVLAEFLAEFLEEVHAELTKDFNYEPKDKVLVELFNNHEMFSGRTVALPDLHTIGACTGKVVTMVSPNGRGLSKRFHWGRVIRHELVHIFNLAQTDFQVPHWLTEGLAVRNERMARPPIWNTILREAYDKKELLTLDTILLGFVRPRSPDQWSLAYCQSEMYVDFLIKTYGQAAVGKMLAAYGEGHGTATAIEQVCKVDKATFEKGYFQYVTEVVKRLPPSPAAVLEKAMTVAEMEKALEAKPDDHDLAARLASEYLRRRRNAEARKLSDTVLAAKKGHPIASLVRYRLQLAAGEDEAARTTIEAAIKEHPDDHRLLAVLARLCVDAKESNKAAELFEKCRKLDPTEPEYLRQLVTLYGTLEQKDKQAAILREVVTLDADDLMGRVRLAELLASAKQHAEAEKAARDALQIDVNNESARTILVDSLKGQGKTAEAEKMMKRFEGTEKKEKE